MIEQESKSQVAAICPLWRPPGKARVYKCTAKQLHLGTDHWGKLLNRQNPPQHVLSHPLNKWTSSPATRSLTWLVIIASARETVIDPGCGSTGIVTRTNNQVDRQWVVGVHVRPGSGCESTRLTRLLKSTANQVDRIHHFDYICSVHFLIFIKPKSDSCLVFLLSHSLASVET